MKISMPITKKRIENHFHYAWWVYALVAALAIFGWNLMHTVTRYQSPPELKVEWYFAGVQADGGEASEALMEQLHQELLPDMEEVIIQAIMVDDAYGPMQLSTWAFAGEGDLYTLEQDSFHNLASNGAMLDLTPYVESGALKLDGIDLTDCRFTDPDTGKEWLCGVPMNALPGLGQYALYGDNCYMGVLINGGNIDNTVKLLNWLVENCSQPVEGLEETVTPAE